MKVLVIDEWLPWPLDSGKKIRTFNLLRRLAQWHEIVLLCYWDPTRDREKFDVLKKTGMAIWPVEDIRIAKWSWRFYLNVLGNFFSNKPFSTTYHITPALRSAVREAINQELPDLVFCEWTNLAPALSEVDGLPRVISSHNIESQIWQRLGQNGSNVFKRILGRNQARKIEALEREWYPRADCCVTVSSEDLRVIEDYGGNGVAVDNGVDLEFYRIPPFKEEPKTLIFTASFDTFSNQDAVQFFLKDIFPIIKKSDPGIKLWLVGKNPPKQLVKFAELDRNIMVSGTVPDVREYVARADICIVPIRIGGGSRLKILEALAMRKAVVSTSVGAEGLKVQDQKNIIIADTPDKFAQWILRLIQDSGLKKKLGENGFDLVKKEYDWDSLARRLSIVLEKLHGSSKERQLET